MYSLDTTLGAAVHRLLHPGMEMEVDAGDDVYLVPKPIS
jgi:hypothetical protein